MINSTLRVFDVFKNNTSVSMWSQKKLNLESLRCRFWFIEQSITHPLSQSKRICFQNKNRENKKIFLENPLIVFSITIFWVSGNMTRKFSSYTRTEKFAKSPRTLFKLFFYTVFITKWDSWIINYNSVSTSVEYARYMCMVVSRVVKHVSVTEYLCQIYNTVVAWSRVDLDGIDKFCCLGR